MPSAGSKLTALPFCTVKVRYNETVPSVEVNCPSSVGLASVPPSLRRSDRADIDRSGLHAHVATNRYAQVRKRRRAARARRWSPNRRLEAAPCRERGRSKTSGFRRPPPPWRSARLAQRHLPVDVAVIRFRCVERVRLRRCNVTSALKPRTGSRRSCEDDGSGAVDVPGCGPGVQFGQPHHCARKIELACRLPLDRSLACSNDTSRASNVKLPASKRCGQRAAHADGSVENARDDRSIAQERRIRTSHSTC